MSSPGPKEESTPRWKFAIVVWLAIFPMITLMNYLLAPYIEGYPIWQKTLLFTVLEIPYAVFFAIPVLQRVFKPWLKDQKWIDS